MLAFLGCSQDFSLVSCEWTVTGVFRFSLYIWTTCFKETIGSRSSCWRTSCLEICFCMAEELLCNHCRNSRKTIKALIQRKKACSNGSLQVKVINLCSYCCMEAIIHTFSSLVTIFRGLLCLIVLFLRIRSLVVSNAGKQ